MYNKRFLPQTSPKPPDTSSEKDQPQIPKDNKPDVKDEDTKVIELENRPRNDKPSKDDEGKLEKEGLNDFDIELSNHDKETKLNLVNLKDTEAIRVRLGI